MTSSIADIVCLALLTSPLLAACGTPDDEAGPGSTAATKDPTFPYSYTYDLKSSCGERSLIGSYRVTVVDGTVTKAAPTDGRPAPQLDQVPTLQRLLELADDAGPGAVVDLDVDDDGLPVRLSIDHDPDAIDDEECYEVSDVATFDAF
jgi:hypothetical protein